MGDMRPGRPVLPFVVSEMVSHENQAQRLALSARDVNRCVQAIDFFINSFGDRLIADDMEKELALYEELLYRLMGVPEENMQQHVEMRLEDLRNAQRPHLTLVS